MLPPPRDQTMADVRSTAAGLGADLDAWCYITEAMSLTGGSAEPQLGDWVVFPTRPGGAITLAGEPTPAVVQVGWMDDELHIHVAADEFREEFTYEMDTLVPAAYAHASWARWSRMAGGMHG